MTSILQIRDITALQSFLNDVEILALNPQRISIILPFQGNLLHIYQLLQRLRYSIPKLSSLVSFSVGFTLLPPTSLRGYHVDTTVMNVTESFASSQEWAGDSWTFTNKKGCPNYTMSSFQRHEHGVRLCSTQPLHAFLTDTNLQQRNIAGLLSILLPEKWRSCNNAPKVRRWPMTNNLCTQS